MNIKEGLWIRFKWLEKDPVVGYYEHINRPLDPNKARQFLVHLNHNQLLKYSDA
jgi:hypothetical protein